jgi:CAAX protease family protein
LGGLLKFFAITYAVTWTCFILVSAIPIPRPHSDLIVLLGTFAPGLVAISLTARDMGGTGVRALLRRVVQWRANPRWYLFALGYMAVIKLAVALVHYGAYGAWPRFGGDPWYLIPLAIIFSTPFQAGEEIGWRGYALPRLSALVGLAGASLLLGLIWAFWHLPLFFLRGADKYGQSFFMYLLQVVAISVAISWLWARTRRSLLLPMLMHAAINYSKDIVPSVASGATNPFTLKASVVGWLTVGGLWIGAACFLVRMPKAHLLPGDESPSEGRATEGST